MSLTVPKPTLTGELAADGHTKQAKPIEVVCGAVSLPGGQGLELANAARFGFLIYRAGPGPLEVWDPAGRVWRNGASTAPGTVELKPLLRQNDGSWKGTLVAIGEKDATGADVFSVDTGAGMPRYMVRCYFAARQPADEGVSDWSDPILLAGLDTGFRVGVASDPKAPESARQITVFAKDAALSTRAHVTLYSEDPTRRLELSALTAGGTVRILIRMDGSIALEPAPGRSVVIAGDIDVGRVFYQPVGGQPKQYLPYLP